MNVRENGTTRAETQGGERARGEAMAKKWASAALSSSSMAAVEPKSHDVVPLPNSTAHHPSINLAIPIIQQACMDCKVQALSEQDGTGQLRYLAINVERSTGALQITLVWNGSCEDQGADKAVLDALIQNILSLTDTSPSRVTTVEVPRQHFKLHSLWVHYHAASKHDNAIFGRDSNSWKCVYGPPSIGETVEIATGENDDSSKCPYRVTLEFPPNVFRQANIDAFGRIIGVIRKRIVQFNTENIATNGKNSLLPSCVELYGGVGTIGLHLVDLTSKFVSSDENPYNVACFQKAASALPKNLQSRVLKDFCCSLVRMQ